MSEVAGRMAVQEGAKYLEKVHGGRGVLLGGVPGVPPAKVVIIGGGVVGINAAKMAAGLGDVGGGGPDGGAGGRQVPREGSWGPWSAARRRSRRPAGESGDHRRRCRRHQRREDGGRTRRCRRWRAGWRCRRAPSTSRRFMGAVECCSAAFPASRRRKW